MRLPTPDCGHWAIGSLVTDASFRRPSTIAVALERTPQDRLAVAAAAVGITSFSRALTTRRGVISWLGDRSVAVGSACSQISCASAAQVVAANGGGDSSGSVVQPALVAFRGTPNTAQLPLRQRSAVTPVSSHSLANSSSLTKREEVAGSKVKSPKLWWRPSDYLGDVDNTARELAPMVAEAAARAVKITTEVCMRPSSIRPGTVDRMEADEAALRECFADHLQHKL